MHNYKHPNQDQPGRVTNSQSKRGQQAVNQRVSDNSRVSQGLKGRLPNSSTSSDNSVEIEEMKSLSF